MDAAEIREQENWDKVTERPAPPAQEQEWRVEWWHPARQGRWRVWCGSPGDWVAVAECWKREDAERIARLPALERENATCCDSPDRDDVT